MTDLADAMLAYKKQIAKGTLPFAYKSLMDYMMGLRTELKNRHPDFYVSGNFYQGYMDMTYFSFTPNSFRKRKLRIAIVFIHCSCKFKIWLGGINKNIQQEYWQKFTDNKWKKYQLVPSPIGVESIIETSIVPDFNNLPALSKNIEKTTVKFAKDIEQFLAEY